MTEGETVARLASLLLCREPFVHVRFGDGDVFFATGTGPRFTGDGESWTPELRDRLRWAWRTLARAPGLLLGDVESYAVSDGCERQWRELLAEATGIRGEPPALVNIEALRASRSPHALTFYLAVATDPRPKVWVAPERLSGVCGMLGAVHVVVPLRTAHEDADALAERVIDSGAQVALFAAGRGGKIMQALLSEWAPRLTQVDVGSGLDILFEDGVRRGTDLGVDETAVAESYAAAGLVP